MTTFASVLASAVHVASAAPGAAQTRARSRGASLEWAPLHATGSGAALAAGLQIAGPRSRHYVFCDTRFAT
jgi:hypothetical protein